MFNNIVNTITKKDTNIKENKTVFDFKSFLTPNDVAKLLGNVSLQAVYKYMKSNDIETVTTSNKRHFIYPREVRKLLLSKGYSYPKENISFQIIKGGTGKTSMSFALAIRAYHYGARILLVDMDQQGNLSRSLGVENLKDRKVFLDILKNNLKFEDAIISIDENLDIIPSNLNNSKLDLELIHSNIEIKTFINKKLKSIRDNYDLVIFDCPPAINKINTCVTCASDLVIIPVNPDAYAVDGMHFTISELESLKKEFELKFDYKILWNRYDSREKLGPYYLHETNKIFADVNQIIPVIIQSDTALKNSVFNAKNIFELKKGSGIREDIDLLTHEILHLKEFF